MQGAQVSPAWRYHRTLDLQPAAQPCLGHCRVPQVPWTFLCPLPSPRITAELTFSNGDIPSHRKVFQSFPETNSLLFKGLYQNQPQVPCEVWRVGEELVLRDLDPFPALSPPWRSWCVVLMLQVLCYPAGNPAADTSSTKGTGSFYFAALSDGMLGSVWQEERKQEQPDSPRQPKGRFSMAVFLMDSQMFNNVLSLQCLFFFPLVGVLITVSSI